MTEVIGWFLKTFPPSLSSFVRSQDVNWRAVLSFSLGLFLEGKKKKVSKKKLSNLRTVTNQTTLFCCYSRLCTRPHEHTRTIPGSVLSISRHSVDFCSFCSNLTLDQCPFDSVPKFTASHSQVQHPGSAEPCLILILNE